MTMPSAQSDSAAVPKMNHYIYGAFLFVVLLILVFRPVPHTFERTLDHIDVALKEAIEKKSNITMGIDVSHFQGDVDWPSIAHKLGFAFIKGTEGMAYVDPKFKANAQNLKLNNINFGVYHFYLPNEDPKKQAEHFLQTIQGVSPELRPVLDVELSQGLDKKAISKGVTTWLNIVETALGCTPILYSYASFYDSYLGREFNDYPFWLAGFTDQLKPPVSRNNVDIWQYSEKGMVSGVSGAVDLDKALVTSTTMQDMNCQYSTDQTVEAKK